MCDTRARVCVCVCELCKEKSSILFLFFKTIFFKIQLIKNFRNVQTTPVGKL